MSWEATAWAKKTRGHRSASTKLVLMVLAECHHPEDDIAWPSQKYLADNCEMPLRTVQWCLAHLEANGFITTLRKGNQYHRTEYQLNFTITHSPSDESAISEPATITGTSEPAILDTVNPQWDASEPATPRITNLQGTDSIEPTVPLLNIVPEWFRTLSQDPRWHGKEPERYIKSIEKTYSGINLDLEAHSAYEWLQTPKGQKKKVLRGFWTGWLKRTLAQTEVNGRPSHPRATRGEVQTDVSKLKESWLGHLDGKPAG